MTRNILSLTKKLIAIKSIPENPKELKKILKIALSKLEGFSVEFFEKNGIESVLVHNAKKRPSRFKILLNGHLDVIPGKEKQYLPKIKGDRLYGVGSMDMKANVACLIMAFKEAASKVNYPLGLQLVTDEQMGGFNGTKYQIEKGVRAEFIIAGEPTNFDIVNQAKGVLWLNISSAGKAAHGAYPWRGENAIWKMHDFLNDLKRKYPNPKQEEWATTLNLSKIETANKSFNKIPDNCTVGIDIRYIPNKAGAILEDIKKNILPKGFELEVVANEPALDTRDDNIYLISLRSAAEKVNQEKIILRGAQGSSDARHFASVNCPGVEFGPIGDGIGSDHEWVSISSLEKYYQILKHFLLSV